MYEGILWDYGVTASVPSFVRSNALWSIAFIVHNLSPRVFFSVHLWRSPESFDLWWKKGWSGVKGNPSVIPGYDLASPQLSWLPQVNVCKYCPLTHFSIHIGWEKWNGSKVWDKKTSICVVGARGAYIMGRIGIFGARPIMPQAPLAK